MSAQAAQPKLAWPPIKEDLQRLYVDEKLSAAKIAKVYGLKTGNPRSAAFLVTYHLRKHGIDRRDRIEELRKETEAVVAAWRARYPKKEDGEQSRPAEEEGQADNPVWPTAEEKAVIELLQDRNLSIRYLDPETKGRVKAAMGGLHWTRRLSLNDIADLVGNKTSGYSSYLFKELGIKPRDFEEARLKGIYEKVRKYERKPFDGTDEDKAYLLGISHGDFHVSRPFGDAVRVSTSSTHPAMAELFISFFEKHGHVYLHPRYKKDTDTYEWNLSTTLDDSFAFMLMTHEESWNWVGAEKSRILGYLAGLFDAEGTIGIYPNAPNTSLTLAFYNTNLDLMNQVHEWLSRVGYHPLPPYLEKPKGTPSSGFKIVIKKDYWRVLVATLEESKALLKELSLRHPERVTKKAIGLSVHKGDRWISTGDRVEEYRKAVRMERNLFVTEAERLYLTTHENPRVKKSDPT